MSIVISLRETDKHRHIDRYEFEGEYVTLLGLYHVHLAAQRAHIDLAWILIDAELATNSEQLQSRLWLVNYVVHNSQGVRILLQGTYWPVIGFGNPRADAFAIINEWDYFLSSDGKENTFVVGPCTIKNQALRYVKETILPNNIPGPRLVCLGGAASWVTTMEKRGLVEVVDRVEMTDGDDFLPIHSKPAFG